MANLIGINPRDPEQAAGFLIRMGYDRDNVVNSLVSACNVDRITARRIVDAQLPNTGGH